MAKAKAPKVVVIDKVAKPSSIVTTAKALVKALNDSIIEAKKTIPILTHVRIVNQTMYGTDLDLATIVEFDGKGENDFMLPRKAALDVLKGEQGVLTLTPVYDDKSERRFVRLEINDTTFELGTLSTSNFPQIPKPAKALATISGKCMEEVLDRTLFAISNEDSRYTLNGGRLDVDNGIFRLVTTDGHRMSIATGKGKGAHKDTIIVRAALNWLAKHCKGDVSFGMDETHHTIRTGDGIVIARKLSGQFPRWESYINTTPAVVASFHSNKELLDKVRRVSKCSDERSGAIRFSFEPSGSSLHASSTERGKASAKVACVVKGVAKGASLDIGFNSEYWVEFLNAIGDETFTAGIVDPNTAIHLKTANFDHIIMPLRI